jgi:preprotein translocase subunit SecE
VTGSSAGRRARGAFLYLKESKVIVAKVSPGEFVRQVRLEAIQRVHWPTRKETISTAIMVIIMTSMLALFFFGVDAFFSTLVKFLLGLLAK